MRILIQLAFIASLFMGSTIANAWQPPIQGSSEAPSLLGIWRHDSPAGKTYLRLRSDQWYFAYHHFSDSPGKVYGVESFGSWKLENGQLVLDQLKGWKKLSLVPSKRSFTLSDVTSDSFTLGEIPLNGQRFVRTGRVHDDVWRYLSGSRISESPYYEESDILPIVPMVNAETLVSIRNRWQRIHLYLLPEGEFLGLANGGNNPLKGTWQKFGDILNIKGETKSSGFAIVMELIKTKDKYKLVKYEVNGKQYSRALEIPEFVNPPSVTHTDNELSKGFSTEFFEKMFAGIHGHKQVMLDEALYDYGKPVETQPEQPLVLAEMVVKADATTGVMQSYSKLHTKPNRVPQALQTSTHFNNLFGVFFSQQTPSSYGRVLYSAGVINKQDPLTIQWHLAEATPIKGGRKIFDMWIDAGDGRARKSYQIEDDGKPREWYTANVVPVESDRPLEAVWEELESYFKELQSR